MGDVYGADISEFQSGVPDGDFIVIRAWSGYRLDKKVNQHWAAAKGRYRLGRAVYGYVVPDRTPAAQADALVDAVAHDPPELGYVADLEQDGLSAGQCAAYCERLIERVGRSRTVFYSYIPFFNAVLDGHPLFDSLPFWLAHYGRNDGNVHPIVNPAPPRPYFMHQFTSKWQGQSLDGNIADEDRLLAAFDTIPLEEDDLPYSQEALTAIMADSVNKALDLPDVQTKLRLQSAAGTIGALKSPAGRDAIASILDELLEAAPPAAEIVDELREAEKAPAKKAPAKKEPAKKRA